MTGRPAETWRKFRFWTPPPWAYALLVLVLLELPGLIVAAIVTAAVSEKATGFLPLTRSSRRLVGLAFWVPIGFIIASVTLWTLVIAAALAGVDSSDPAAGGAAGALIGVGVILLMFGLIGRLVMTPLLSPRARVTVAPGYHDKLVEIRNVHPAFVAAVVAIHQQRAAVYAQPNLPQVPGSN